MTFSSLTKAYVTITEASSYFAVRMNTDAWDDEVQDSVKQKAIYDATARIDRLRFSSVKTSSDQVLEFPRGSETAIPDDIKMACCEIVLSLLDGVVPDLEVQSSLIKSQGVKNATVTYTPEATPVYVLLGIPSHTAWLLLKPYLAGSDIRLDRVS